MNKSRKVPVIMPCFNHGEFLPEAVESVNKEKRDDIELIVVDDGSRISGRAKKWKCGACRG
jgi:glycosyltransferase involved in cell wall biosynthesis